MMSYDISFQYDVYSMQHSTSFLVIVTGAETIIHIELYFAQKVSYKLLEYHNLIYHLPY